MVEADFKISVRRRIVAAGISGTRKFYAHHRLVHLAEEIDEW